MFKKNLIMMFKTQEKQLNVKTVLKLNKLGYRVIYEHDNKEIIF